MADLQVVVGIFSRRECRHPSTGMGMVALACRRGIASIGGAVGTDFREVRDPLRAVSATESSQFGHRIQPRDGAARNAVTPGWRASR